MKSSIFKSTFYEISSVTWPDLCCCSVANSCPTLLQPHRLQPIRLLFTGFPRQKYCSGLPFPTPGDLLDPETESSSPEFSALAGGFSTTEPPGKPQPYLTIPLFWLTTNRHASHNIKETKIIYSSTPHLKLENLGEWQKLTGTSINILFIARKHSRFLHSRINLHAGQPSYLIKFVRVTSEVKNIIHMGNAIGILIHSKESQLPFQLHLFL